MQDQVKVSIFQNTFHEGPSSSRPVSIVVDIMSGEKASRGYQVSPGQKIVTRIEIIMRRIDEQHSQRRLSLASIVAAEHPVEFHIVGTEPRQISIEQILSFCAAYLQSIKERINCMNITRVRTSARAPTQSDGALALVRSYFHDIAGHR